ncbi:MAG TPA: hypothetical protein VN372_07950 [Methanospirillum sp.]|nr:hypothetical protein [Methanospirillum sp.]
MLKPFLHPQNVYPLLIPVYLDLGKEKEAGIAEQQFREFLPGEC